MRVFMTSERQRRKGWDGEGGGGLGGLGVFKRGSLAGEIGVNVKWRREG